MGDLQTDVEVDNNSITGMLHYYDDDTKPLVQRWGAGYFVALKFDSDADSIKAGMDPSEGSGLVELDEDKNGVWKVTNKERQNFKVIAKSGGTEETRYYDLSGLTLSEDDE